VRRRRNFAEPKLSLAVCRGRPHRPRFDS
jgi:hypothetical protein